MAKEIAKRDAAELDVVKANVNIALWLNSLATNVAYVEPNPEYLQRAQLMRLLNADTAEEILADDPINGLQNLIPDVEGASTGPIEIIDLYVAESKESSGYSTYVHFTFVDLESGQTIRTTTGAGQIQGQLVNMLRIGSWPIKCQIKRLKATDQGGKHLMRMFPPD